MFTESKTFKQEAFKEVKKECEVSTNVERKVYVWVCVSLYRASPQKWPTACGCWVSESGEFHTLVWRQPGPPRRSVTPGTACTEYVEETYIESFM